MIDIVDTREALSRLMQRWGWSEDEARKLLREAAIDGDIVPYDIETGEAINDVTAEDMDELLAEVPRLQ